MIISRKNAFFFFFYHVLAIIIVLGVFHCIYSSFCSMEHVLYENGKVECEKWKIYIPPPPAGLSNAAMGIATLKGHRMTFSHSSKDPLRPLSGGESKRRPET